MSISQKQIQIYYYPPPPPFPADSCAHRATTFPLVLFAGLMLNGLAAHAADPVLITRASNTVTQMTIFLTNHFANFYYNYTPGGTCSSTPVPSYSDVNVSDLKANTSYVFTAYSDSTCSTVLATAAATATKPPKPPKPIVTRSGSGELTITSSISGNNVGDAALTGWKYKKRKDTKWDSTWTEIDSTSKNLSYTITGLTNDINYQFAVRAVNASGEGKNSPVSDPMSPVGNEKLGIAMQNTGTGATILLYNYIGNFYYNYMPGGTCSSTSVPSYSEVNVSGLQANTSYVFAAYRDSTCSTRLTTTAATPTKPPKPSKPIVTRSGSGKLTITSSISGDNVGDAVLTGWKYKKREGNNWDSTWTEINSASKNLSHTITGLTNDINYQFAVRAVNASGEGRNSSVSDLTSPTNVTLAASTITRNSATLTISQHSGNWYYRANAAPHTSCSSSPVSTTSTNLTSLVENTSYTYKAYNNSNCSTELAAHTFLTKPGKPTQPTATWGAGSGTLTLASSLSGSGALTKWQYTKDNGTNWIDIDATSTTLNYQVTGLTDDSSYTFKVRAVNATGTGPDSDASTAVQPTNVTLAASTISGNSATLTISQHSGNWYYKANATPHTSCSSNPVSTTSTNLTSLVENTSYTYKAYNNSNCSTELAAHTFLTKPGKPTQPTATSGAGSGTLILASSLSGSGALTKWQYTKDNGTNWIDIDATSTTLNYQVTGLTDGSSYTFKVRAVNATGTGPDSDASTAATPASGSVTLAASNITHNSAVLTIGDYNGSWYYKYTTPSNGSCSANPVSASLAKSVKLTENTSYTFKAYSDSSCTAELATTVPFLTKPAKPSKPTVTPAAGNNLTLSSTLTGGSGALVRWEYTKDAGTTWENVSDTDNTLSHLVPGPNNTNDNYIFKVRAVNATGTGPASDASEHAFMPPDPVASVTVVHQGNSLAVTWPAAARATHYHVTYSSNNGVSWQLGALEYTGTSLIINGVDSTKTYIVGVRAKNTAGSSGWTNSAATLGVPDPVASVTAVHKGSSLAVSWPAAARAASYHVTYSGNNGTSWQLAALGHSGTSLTINGVDSTKTYLVGVRAKNAAGASGWVNSAPAAPPALSVADATAAELGAGQSATLDFVVTLNRAASGTVTVNYATSDGTATLGADYTAASGTLTFAAGETSKTVSVPVLNDAHDEGSETLTLTLSNATGAVIADGQATGTITNAGPMPQAWISRFGRTVADQVLDAVATRLRSEPTPGMEVTLAGERLGWSTDSGEGHVEQLAQWLMVSNGDTGDVGLRTIEGRELVANSSFAFASPSSGGSLFSFWGRGAVTNFEGREGELSLDGEVTTWLLGTDWSWGQGPGGEARRSTAGLLLSRSRADGGYDSPAGASSGDVAATLTGVFPWGSHRFTDRLEVWGTVGYGQGELEVTPKLPDRDKDGVTLTTDLNLWLAAAGLRGTLLDGGNDGLTITGTTDAMVVGNTSERVTGLEAAQATVTRLRLGVEAQRPITLGKPESVSGADSEAVLTPSLEMELRHDGGDAETGFGLDLGGGIVLSHPQRGLEAEVRGRGLLSHAAEGFRDQGFSGSLSWQQRPDSDLGAALSLSQTMGGSSSAGADALLSRVNLEGLAANDGDDDLNNQRLDLQLSYGFLAFGDRFTLTPELGLGLYDSGRDYRIGWRLTHLVETGAFDLSFDVTRRESANNDGTAPDHGVQLEVNTRF